MLKSLDLSLSGKVNIGAEGAASLAESLKVNSTLTTLNLFNNGIGDMGAADVAEALLVNTALTALHLGKNGNTPQLARRRWSPLLRRI